MIVPGFKKSRVPAEAGGFEIYERGSGPAIVVMHEIPGITDAVYEFANRMVEHGFSVVMPSLFGNDGEPLTVSGSLREISRACISREFAVLAAHRSSPITDRLRLLCRYVRDQQDGVPVAAIGMCLTGNFAIALMVDDAVIAPILSQPSLPFCLTPSLAAAIHVSPEEIEQGQQRIRNDGLRVLGMRFTHDVMCPGKRFETLRETYGDAFEGIEIDSSIGNKHGLPPWAHSVVTNDFVAEDGHPTLEAFNRLVEFIHEQLETYHENNP